MEIRKEEDWSSPIGYMPNNMPKKKAFGRLPYTRSKLDFSSLILIHYRLRIVPNLRGNEKLWYHNEFHLDARILMQERKFLVQNELFQAHILLSYGNFLLRYWKLRVQLFRMEVVLRPTCRVCWH